MIIRHDRAEYLFMRAAFSGGRLLSPTSIEWDISGNCETPYVRELLGRPGGDIRAFPPCSDAPYPAGPIVGQSRDHSYYVGGPRTLRIFLHTRCRSCTNCMKQRAGVWYHRARSEIEKSFRTWFGTLTFHPEAYFLVEARARHRMRLRHVQWTQVDQDERFRLIAKSAGEEVTKFMKRVRKNSGSKFRYLIVVEKHKSGVPHFHLLLHELDAANPVRYRVLSKAWDQGFSDFKLVDNKDAAGYVSKYLAKAMLARVRASQGYGKD